jgi:hypothetical protein
MMMMMSKIEPDLKEKCIYRTRFLVPRIWSENLINGKCLMRKLKGETGFNG